MKKLSSSSPILLFGKKQVQKKKKKTEKFDNSRSLLLSPSSHADVKFKDRMNLYLDDFFAKELEIHWLSIMNSFVLVLLLTGFLAIIIMRVLKSDYSRYQQTDEEDGKRNTPFAFVGFFCFYSIGCCYY
jgi:hypothetical protein